MMSNNKPGMKNTVPARDCNTKTGAVCLGETNVKCTMTRIAKLSLLALTLSCAIPSLARSQF